MTDIAKNDAAAARMKHWLIQHPGRAAAARFPIDDLWSLLDERNQLADQLNAVTALAAASGPQCVDHAALDAILGTTTAPQDGQQ